MSRISYTRDTVRWVCACCFVVSTAYSADDLKTLDRLRKEADKNQSPQQVERVGGKIGRSVASIRRVLCPDPVSLDLLKHQIAYQKTEDLDPLRGLPVIHADVWMRGPLTAFYVREQLSGFIPGVRHVYLFGKDGLRGGGTCQTEKNWRECVEEFAGVEYANDVVTTCTTVIAVRAVPAWVPSPNDPKKLQIAVELRHEIETLWRGAQEIVVRDFNLKDNQITIYLKMPDGERFQGCGFHVMREPHCEGWHSFGSVPAVSLRRWIFDKPYRLK